MTRIALATLLLIAAQPIMATEWTVLPDGSGDFATIQDALSAAVGGDVIFLGDGTFVGEGNRDIDFLGKAVTVKSMSGDPESCVIDCQSQGRGFRFASGEGPGSIIEAVSIINGFVDDPDHLGGAILFGSSTSPQILGCIFKFNRADVGGALGGEETASPFLSHCRFEQNEAYGGGGACFWGDVPIAIEHCDFVDNDANWGGGLAVTTWSTSSAGSARDHGRGFSQVRPVDIRRDGRGPSVSLSHCTFFSNISRYWPGGGAYLRHGTHQVQHCSFMRNGGDIEYDAGSGLRISGPPVNPSTIENCTFADHSYEYGIRAPYEVSLIIENCIFAFNSRGVSAAEVTLDVNCTDVYGNENGDWVGILAPFEGINGNFSEDPLICGIHRNDASLDTRSPCLPENNTCGVLIGSAPEGCDLYDGTYLVLPDGTGDFANIQEAIDAAFTEVIELGDGVFTGYRNCEPDFRGLPITLRSKSGNPEACILDGEGSYHLNFDEEGPRTVIDGITIRNSDSNGIRCYIASPTIRNCSFENFSGYQGTAISLWSSNSLIENCSIVGSQRLNPQDTGSPIYLRYSEPTLRNIVIAFNDCDLPIELENSTVPELSCCLIYGNEGGDWIGGLEGQENMNGNLWAHPKFCGEFGSGSPLTLTLNSPCLPENNDCGVRIGAFGLGCQILSHVIEGTALDMNSMPIEGVDFNLPMQDPYTDSAGRFEFWFPAGTDVLLAPVLAGYEFEPPVRIYDDLIEDLLDQDFTGTWDLIAEVPSEFATIGEAVAQAHDGDSILVAPGTYNGVGNRDIDFEGKDLVLIGLGGSSETTIDCQNAGRFLYFHQGETAASLISGFRILNGLGSSGGAIHCNESSPRFHDLIIESCHSTIQGGAIYCREEASPEFRDLTLLGNWTNGDGGAIDIEHDCYPSFETVLIAGNSASENGGGVDCSEHSVPSFQNVSIVGNEVGWYGAGMSISHYSEPIIQDCIIAFNTGESGIYGFASADVDLQCSDIFGHEDGEFGGYLDDQIGIDGNISLDPLFCDAEGGDFSLDYASPCLPVNNDCGVLMGAFGAGCGDPTGAAQEASAFRLSQNFPNPFNPSTEIRFSLAQDCPVELVIFDASGRRVRSLVQGERLATGEHAFVWDGESDLGESCSSGHYFYRLHTPVYQTTGKMVLLK